MSANEFLLFRPQIPVGNIEPSLATRFGPELFVVVPGVLRLGPRIDSALFERKIRVRDDQIEIVIHGVAEALANRTCTHWIVETEHAGLGRRCRQTTFLAAECLAKMQARGFGDARLLEANFSGFSVEDLDGSDQPLMRIRLNDNAVGQYKERLREIDFE